VTATKTPLLQKRMGEGKQRKGFAKGGLIRKKEPNNTGWRLRVETIRRTQKTNRFDWRPGWLISEGKRRMQPEEPSIRNFERGRISEGREFMLQVGMRKGPVP